MGKVYFQLSEKTVEVVTQPKKYILPSLAIARFAITPPGIVSGFLLVDIAATYGLPVGVMAQMRTTSNILSMIAALVMAVLSVRYRHKSLALIGMAFIVVAGVGCFWAPTYSSILIIYSLVGLGSSMVNPMTMTLAGEHLPREKRSDALGWIIAGASMSYLIGAPIIAYIAEIGNWRTVFILYVVPVALIGLILLYIGIPKSEEGVRENVDYIGSFKGVLTNSSAIACLTASALSMASYQAILVYSASFYRQQFLISRSFVSTFVIGGALFFTIGSVTSGRLVERYGRKPVTVITGLIAGLFIASYTNLPNLWLSASARFLGGLFTAFAFSTIGSLTLEQVPEFRGTLMSIRAASNSVGSALGSFLGGLALLWYGYEMVGVFLGATAMLASVIIHFIAKDPT